MNFRSEIEDLITYTLEEKYNRHSFGNRILENNSGNNTMMRRNCYMISNYDNIKQKYIQMKLEQLCSGKSLSKYKDFERINAYRLYLQSKYISSKEMDEKAKKMYDDKIKEKYAGVDPEVLISELVADQEIKLKEQKANKKNKRK